VVTPAAFAFLKLWRRVAGGSVAGLGEGVKERE